MPQSARMYLLKCSHAAYLNEFTTTSRQPLVTTNSIVLHSRRYGDTSRIVVLFTEELGKVSVVARGSRKPQSTFGSSLEPLTIGRVGVYHRKNRDLHTLGTADTHYAWKNLHGSLEHMETALMLCKLIMRTQPEEVPAPDVYALLRATLEQMEAAESDVVYRLGVQARVTLADIMGFALQFRDSPNQGVLHVNLDNGQQTVSSGYQISSNAYNVLANAPFNNALVPQEDRVDIEAFISQYFSYHLGKYV